jgi:serine protease Do
MPGILRNHKAAALLTVAIVLGTAASPLLPAVAVAAEPVHVNSSVASDNSIASVVEADKPAVVTITSTMKADASDTASDNEMDEQFRQFFERQGIPLPHQQQKQTGRQNAMALGSGFIVGADGTIVTNNHVIDKATSIKVTLDDGTELPAKLVGADPKSDLAVLKVEAKHKLPTIAWGDSDKLKLGDQIIAIGNPFGIGTTVTSGIVSARGRDLHSGPYDDFIQIDAPINHGNSGGPLVDLDGKVVGINTAIYSPNGGSVGVGFAIPSDQAKLIVAKLEKNGTIDHGFLGVSIQPVTQDVADAIGLSKPEGALVSGVNEDSPAASAGLKSGDIVTAVGDNLVRTPKDLSRLIADLSPGQKEALSVWRDGKTKSIDVTIGGNEGSVEKAAASEHEDVKGPSIGVGLANITPDVREQLNLAKSTKGAIVASVAQDKPAAEAGIREGDLIVSVNNVAVANASEAKSAVGEAGKSGRKSVLLQIERDGKSTFVAVPFAAS